ncbi:hypothetical protein AAVH_33588, partial [Aphelenchoides avenae]
NFEKAERGTFIVRSVTLLHERRDKEPLRFAVEPLGQSRCTKAPTPHSSFIRKWSRALLRDRMIVTESSVAELFVFENAKAAKKLELFVWTVKQGTDDEWSVFIDFLHYAFFLQVVDL